MDAFPDNTPPPKFDLITIVLIAIAGVDKETLRRSTPHDVSNIRAIATLMLCVWLYQSSLLSIVAHQLMATDGQIHPAFILGGMLTATLILLIDSYVFLRSGFHIDGLRQLARGGLDLTGDIGAKLKAGIFLILRLGLSTAFSALCGVFMGLIIFHADIAADLDHVFQQENAALIATTTRQADAEIQRAANVAQEAGTHVAALQKQVVAMRDGTVNPADSDASVQAAQQEVNQLLVEKSQRDTELAAAQKFGSDELAGIKGDPRNSGVRGPGPVRAAAEERVRTATANVAAASQALAEARSRLADLRKQTASTSGERGRQAQLLLPQLESDLQAATAQLAVSRDNLAQLTAHRDETIRAQIDNAPDRVGRGAGLLAQLSALRRAAQDPEIAAVILLIDLTSFGLELAAVLSKVTSFIPMTYTALLARDAYMQNIRIVDQMDAELKLRPPAREGEAPPIQKPPVPETGTNDRSSFQAFMDFMDKPFTSPPTQFPFNLFTVPSTPSEGGAETPSPTKRRRGRPRKPPTGNNVIPMPTK